MQLNKALNNKRKILPPFQIIDVLPFLNILFYYALRYMSRYIAKITYLKRSKRLIIWNETST